MADGGDGAVVELLDIDGRIDDTGPLPEGTTNVLKVVRTPVLVGFVKLSEARALTVFVGTLVPLIESVGG